jgi:hypothetical protein
MVRNRGWGICLKQNIYMSEMPRQKSPSVISIYFKKMKPRKVKQVFSGVGYQQEEVVIRKGGRWVFYIHI